jgi:hypothetical protein
LLFLHTAYCVRPFAEPQQPNLYIDASMASTTTRSNFNDGKKRKRNKEQSVLPEIPGVPIDVAPYLVEALQLATKVFQRSNITSHSRMKPPNLIQNKIAEDHHHRPSAFNNDDTTTTTTTTTNNNLTVHDSLMNRVETATQQPSDAAREEEERLNRLNAALGKWLETLKRFARGKPAISEDAESSSKAASMSVPYACFVYLWQLQQDHPRVPVRRAALLLSGPLLQKSRDCRFHLEQDSNLSTWISNIAVEGGGTNTPIWKNPEQAKKQLPLLQKEAFWLLSYLVDEGYAELYPKLGVAQQRLAQQCPNLNLEDSADVSEMATRRRLRDIALEHGGKEIKRVQKILHQCHACLEILVPRIGVETNAVEKDDSDDDDDDIDWDDGDNFGEGDIQTASESDHLAAVERTLATMKSSGGLRGGEIEIDLARTDAVTGTGDEAPVNLEMLSKLENHTKVLAGRHLPRLTRWLDGLVNADNLVVGASSLVSLPASTAKQRKDLVDQLSGLKQEASSIISSASRLDIKPNEDPTAASSSTSLRPALRPGFAVQSTGRRGPLVSSRERQRRLKPANLRSNRVAIKLRK